MRPSLIGSLLGLTASISHAEVDPALELEFGQFRDQLMLATNIVVLDEELNRRINEVGQRVAAGCPREDLEYTFRIVSSPAINAYATSGGFVYVNTGLLDIAQSEDELAGILAHEVAHACATHLIKKIRSTNRKKQAFSAGGLILGEILGAEFVEALAGKNFGGYVQTVQTIQSAQDFGKFVGQFAAAQAAQATISRYSKQQELEADSEAIAYVLAANYDPYALPRFLKRLQTMEDTFQLDVEHAASSLINAEPGLSERIEYLQQVLPENEKRSVQ